jgi:amino acid transporter
MAYKVAAATVMTISLVTMMIFNFYVLRIRKKDRARINKRHIRALTISIFVFAVMFVLYIALDYLLIQKQPSITALIGCLIVLQIVALPPIVTLFSIKKKKDD